MLGLKFAPMTVLMVVTMWDHQHSLMQQHGLARIYDFKAGTGAAMTGRFDLLLHWVLYGNLLLTAPPTNRIWLFELYRWQLPISADAVRDLHAASYTVTGVYVCVYLGHLFWCLTHGYQLNPVKYLFIGASYFLWYFTAWHTDSALVFGIAHRLMHGLQYMVIVHFFMKRMKQRVPDKRTWWARKFGAGNVTALVVLGLIYLFIYQILVNAPLEPLGFGVVNFTAVYHAIPSLGLEAIEREAGYELFAETVINAAAMTHYYFDSFIWKVSDSKTQEGL